MRRITFIVVFGLGLILLGLWLWQGSRDVARHTLLDFKSVAGRLVKSEAERIAEMTPDELREAQQKSYDELRRTNELEPPRPLTPEERAAYIAAVNQILHERIVIYKGRLRLGDERVADYVPLALISVSCNSLPGSNYIVLRGPGSLGQTKDQRGNNALRLGPPSLNVHDLFTEEEKLLNETVWSSLDAAELYDEVCRMVIDELDHLSARPSSP